MKFYSKIDSLRAFAILLVLMAHWISQNSLISKSIKLGFWGVNLFFIISGFLITGILLNIKNELKLKTVNSTWIQLKNFIIRRGLRILPLYFLTLIPFYFYRLEGFRHNYLPHILFYSNIQFFIENLMQGNLSPRWSLCVEEQFYLLWPFVILFVPLKYLKNIFISLIIFANLFRLFIEVYMPDNIYYQFLTPSNFDSLSIGALLAMDKSKYYGKDKWCIFFESKSKIIIPMLPFLFIGLILFNYYSASPSLLNSILNKNVILIINLSLITIAISKLNTLKLFFNNSIIQYLGKISYGVYLYHSIVPILLYINCGIFMNQYKAYQILIYFIATVFISIISFHLFEKPILKLKKNFM